MDSFNEEARLFIADHNPDAMIADGFDDAIIGSEAINGRAVYDVGRMLDILRGQGMSEEEAFEYLEFNVLGAYVGELTPIFIFKIAEP